MLLQFTKNDGKPHVIKYIRDNGTETWMHSDDYFVRHDLSHYAIESTLSYKDAFNGMINNGMDIRDFENREKRLSMTISNEAVNAENLANLFLVEIAQNTFEDFDAVQQQAFSVFASQYDLLTVTGEQVTGIRTYLRQLLQEWNQLPVAQTLHLAFRVR